MIFACCRENARVWLKRRGHQLILSQTLQVPSTTSIHPHIQSSTQNCLPLGATVVGLNTSRALAMKPNSSASAHTMLQFAHFIYALSHAGVFNVREVGTWRLRSLVGSSYSLQHCKCSSETVATKGNKTSRSHNPKFSIEDITVLQKHKLLIPCK